RSTPRTGAVDALASHHGRPAPCSCRTSSPRATPAVRRPPRPRIHRLTLHMDALALARNAGLTWWRNWLALTVLNLVWMVSWLTVVLGPPVTLAVYSYIERLVAGDDMT